MFNLPSDILKQSIPIGYGIVSDFSVVDHDGVRYVIKKLPVSACDFQYIKTVAKELENLEEWPKGLIPFKPVKVSYDLEIIMPVLELPSEEKDQFFPADLCSLGYPNGSGDPWAFIELLADSIGSLHEHRITHGNIKPGNIFISQKGDLYLTDLGFGVNAEVKKPSLSDSLCYTAPEQLDGSVVPTDKSTLSLDVYAFGVVAYRLLNGAFPRCDAQFSAIADNRYTPVPDKVSNQPKSIADRLKRYAGEIEWSSHTVDQRELERRALIQQCLSLDPLDRPRTMVEVFRELSMIRERKSHVETVDELSDKISKKRRLTVMLSVLTVIGLIVAAFLQAQNNRQDRINRRIVDLKDKQLDRQRKELEDQAREREEKQQQMLASLRSTDTERKSFQDLLDGAWLLNSRVLSWSLRDRSENLPSLDTDQARLAAVEEELKLSISLMENHERYIPRANELRLVLAEIKVHQGDPLFSETLLKELQERKVVLPQDKLARIEFLLGLEWLRVGDVNAGKGALKRAMEFEEKSSTTSSRYIYYVSQLAKFALAKLELKAGRVDQGVQLATSALDALNQVRMLNDVSPRMADLWTEGSLEVIGTLDRKQLLFQESEVNKRFIAELEGIVKGDSDERYLVTLIKAYLTQARLSVGLEDMVQAENYANKSDAVIQKIRSSKALQKKFKGERALLIGEARMGKKSNLYSADEFFAVARNFYAEAVALDSRDFESLYKQAQATRLNAIVKGFKNSTSMERSGLTKSIQLLELALEEASVKESAYYEKMESLRATCHAELAYSYKLEKSLSNFNAHKKKSLELWSRLADAFENPRYDESVSWLNSL